MSEINSKNMNYIFNVEYFDIINEKYFEKKENCDAKYKEILEKSFNVCNKNISNFKFTGNVIDNCVKKIDGYTEFTLATTYLGLIIGMGNPHSLNAKECIKCGFSFDYVTGLPYIPGSSLKGMLRSYFPDKECKNKEEYGKLIKQILSAKCKKEIPPNLVDDLLKNIFCGNDIFLGAYPQINSNSGESLIEMDYITPHKSIFENPVPINIIKIKPNVKMAFMFILHDYKKDDIVISKKDKCELFTELVKLMGIGAKTNVGYGRMVL